MIAVGHACEERRAGYRPLAQALVSDFCAALDPAKREIPSPGFEPDGKVLVALRVRQLVAVTASLQHPASADRMLVTKVVREACLRVAREYAAAGELLTPGVGIDWLVNGTGSLEMGGPHGDNGLSGKKLVVDGFGPDVPIGGGTVHGKDPHKLDVRGQRIARDKPLALVSSGQAREATVWVVFRQAILSRDGLRSTSSGTEVPTRREPHERLPKVARKPCSHSRKKCLRLPRPLQTDLHLPA